VEHQHTIHVGDASCVVNLYRLSRQVWVVVGEYARNRIEVKRSGKNAAIAAWREAARHQGSA
jgi:hypothetical protein